MSDDSSRFSRLIRELRRRRVYRTAALYIIGAWVVIEAAELTFSTFRFPDWSLRGLFVAALLGFPVALIFGWMFEITDRGIVRTARETHTDPDDLDLRLRSKDYVILAALVVVLMAITGGVFINVPQQVEDTAVTTPIENIAANLAQAPKNSIAVLPFVNMSDDKANEYFSDGMTEEILDDLAKLESLHVAARTSSFFFKDKQYTIDQVGDLLGVRYALEGSVRKSGDQVRITAQLIDVDSGFHLWSETWDRELRDIFAVQDDIARRIVDALQIELGAEEIERLESSPPTTDLAAYDLYLRGQAAFAGRGEASIRQAIEFFDEAVARDRDFAEAHAALGAAYAILQEYSDMSEEEAFALAEPALGQALQLDSSLGNAYAAQGYINMRRWNWIYADAAFTTALAYEPGSAQIRQWYSNFLNDVAWQQDGLGEALRTYAFDPVSPGANIVLALNYLWAGPAFNEHVIQHLLTAQSLGYAGSLGDLLVFVVNLRRADYDQALQRYSYALQSHDRDSDWVQPFVLSMEALSSQETGHESRVAEAVAAMSDARQAASISASNHFLFLLLLDQVEAAFDVAEAALGDRGLAYVWFLMPEAASFRSHERFVPLLEKIGLIDYWRKKGAYPDICQPAGDTYICA